MHGRQEFVDRGALLGCETREFVDGAVDDRAEGCGTEFGCMCGDMRSISAVTDADSRPSCPPSQPGVARVPARSASSRQISEILLS